MVQALIIGLSLLTLTTGCATAVSAIGTGVYMAAEYFIASAVSQTVTFDFDRLKKALLIALRKMEIRADKATEIKDGEEIIAWADELEVTISLKKITPMVTLIKVKANKSFISRDKATAQEVVRQTIQIAEKLKS
jgi:hypothetical protein